MSILLIQHIRSPPDSMFTCVFTKRMGEQVLEVYFIISQYDIKAKVKYIPVLFYKAQYVYSQNK